MPFAALAAARLVELVAAFVVAALSGAWRTAAERLADVAGLLLRTSLRIAAQTLRIRLLSLSNCSGLQSCNGRKRGD